jgi:hypothetical protein
MAGRRRGCRHIATHRAVRVVDQVVINEHVIIIEHVVIIV